MLFISQHILSGVIKAKQVSQFCIGGSGRDFYTRCLSWQNSIATLYFYLGWGRAQGDPVLGPLVAAWRVLNKPGFPTSSQLSDQGFTFLMINAKIGLIEIHKYQPIKYFILQKAEQKSLHRSHFIETFSNILNLTPTKIM